MPNVGRPSRDCHACRKRRIKVLLSTLLQTPSEHFEPYLRSIPHGQCDLLRPECTQCQRKSQSCPGYRDELELKFRVESVSTFEAKNAGGNNDKGGMSTADERRVDEQPAKAEK